MRSFAQMIQTEVEDLFDVLTVLDLHAHLFGALGHLQAHLVGELAGNIGAVADVVGHEHGEDGEGQSYDAGRNE